MAKRSIVAATVTLLVTAVWVLCAHGEEDADILNRQVIELHGQGKYAEAARIARRVVEIRSKVLGKEHPDYATSLNNLAVLYDTMGAYNEAEPLYLEARDIFAKVHGKKHALYATSLNNLANLYRIVGAYAKAEPLFVEAASIQEEVLGKEHPDYALTLNNLAELYGAMGAYAKAEALLLQAQDIFAKVYGKEHPHYATSLINLAELYKTTSEYGKAEPLYLEARDVFAKVHGKEHPNYAQSVNNLGLLYEATGAYGQAEPLYLEARDIYARVYGKEHPNYAQSLNNLALLYKKMAMYGKVEPLLLEARDIFAKVYGTEHPNYATSLTGLAGLYLARGDYDKAEPLYLEARDIYAKDLGKEHPSYVTSLNNLAALYDARDAYAKAEPILLEARDIFAKVYGKEHPDYAGIVWNYASLLARTGRVEESLPHYEEALSAYEATRGRIASEEQRLSFQSTMDRAYAVAAAAYRKTGNTLKCFETIERSRAKGLMDLLATRSLRCGQAGDTTEMEVLEHRLKVLRDEQVKAALVPDGKKPRPVEDVRAEDARQREQLELIEAKTRANPEFRDLLTVTAPTLAEVQGLLDEGVALVEYFHCGEVKFQDGKANELWAFVITNHGSNVWPISVTDEDLLDTAGQYVAAVADARRAPSLVASLAAKMHGWLIAPIEKELKPYTTIVIVPWDILYYVPFTALASERGVPFGTQKRVVVSPSAGVYRYVKPKRAGRYDRLLAFGNPKTEAMPLKGAEQEAQVIAKQFKQAQVFLGPDATESAAKARRDSVDVVHFACHGALDRRLPQLSRLLLASDAQNDGRLEVHEIFGLDWKGVSLVTLGACSSGTGKLGAGNDLIGLTRGFMFAGAPSPTSALLK